MRKIIALMLPLLLVAAIIVYGYFIPSSQVFGKVYYQGNTTERIVALTFDDGPNDPYTSQILDILASYDIKATFFVVGKNVELYQQTVRRMVGEGHVIGSHSYSHNANHAVTGYGIRDMRRGDEAIFNITGVKPHLYRPPHGKKSPWELQYVREDGMIEVNWTVATRELIGRPATQEAQDIVNKTRPGSLILLHDGYGTEHNNRRADKSVTVEAVSLIIEKLQAQGYKFVTVPQLLGVTAYH